MPIDPAQRSHEPPAHEPAGQEPADHGAFDDEPGVSISMHADVVVVRTRGPIDRAATADVVGVLHAATACGAVAAVDLDLDPSVTPHPCLPPSGDPHATVRSGTVSVTGPGVVRIGAESSWWTIDLEGRRLCRSDEPVDHRFLAAESWTPVRAVWVSAEGLSALTTDDAYLTTTLGWSPDDGRTPRSAA